MLTSEQLILDWIIGGNTQCRFAQMIAARGARATDQKYIRTNAVPGSTPSRADLLGLNNEIDKAYFGGFASFLAIFPDIKTPEQSTQLIVALCSTPDWYCVNLLPKRTDALYIGLRRILPGGKYVSMTLGLADFPTMPETRRAPFTAIFLRTGGPGDAIIKAKGVRKTFLKTVDGIARESVNLADVDVDFFIDDKYFFDAWNKTVFDVKELKETLPRPVAKALHEIAFILPPVQTHAFSPMFCAEAS